MSLAGQRIVVIGGTSGIGFAVAEAALSEGSAVAVASSNPQNVEAATARLPGAEGFVLDVTDEGAVERAFAGLGRFDHLAFTAGDWGGPRRGLLMDLDLDAGRAIFNVRFWGAAAVAKHAAKAIAPAGSITLTDGMIAHRPAKGSSLSTAMAGAVEHLTRGLAAELAPIRVNCVCPGMIRTGVWDSIPADVREARITQMTARQPLARIGEPKEAAEAYLYLMRGGYTTGQVLRVDGGGSLV
ncbi:MAG TPA: SDR family oxidoreductase [Phenylobacterium sp.]|uniref:SDR family oxidoreductase n=1 Tax=Phenylobacterium sp. TaxID=1871053 RepID=UPI002BD4A731|nr:SDR family oxidoreductase [Phenylobacterium sp.]HSV02785.1 SDR family oxidoreductase [Phenylobacterium sp.]